MDLEIRYENGSMTVHLEEFLSERRIAKVRKLLKVIRSSFTPECEQQMKKFIQEQTEQFEQVQKEQKKELKELKFLLRSRQQSFDRNIRNKDFYKKVLENIT